MSAARTVVAVRVCLLLAFVLAACAERAPQPAADGAAGADVDVCGPVEEPPLQSGSHLLGDQQPPVPYSSAPPTSGWHASGAFEITVHPPDDPLPEPAQVSVLEAGGVVVTYRGIGEGPRLRLEQHVQQHHEGTVAVTPYDQLDPGQVAFTAWGTLRRCDGLDLAALDAFTAAHAAEDADGPGTH